MVSYAKELEVAASRGKAEAWSSGSARWRLWFWVSFARTPVHVAPGGVVFSGVEGATFSYLTTGRSVWKNVRNESNVNDAKVLGYDNSQYMQSLNREMVAATHLIALLVLLIGGFQDRKVPHSCVSLNTKNFIDKTVVRSESPQCPSHQHPSHHLNYLGHGGNNPPWLMWPRLPVCR